jgi:cellulose synthase/poly-beta-1,6-N-acetylglucosamine synthase-like glycosyltransferase
MKDSLSKRNVQLTWICPIPHGARKRSAMLIPLFNESSNYGIDKRLRYFSTVAKKFQNELDVIIIDDGSTDDSLSQIQAFVADNPNSFSLASVRPNAQKVGALYLAAKSIEHEFVILSDYDTDIEGLEGVMQKLDMLTNDSTLMGCYFRLLPTDGKGSIFLFQQLEYSLLRNLYKIHIKEGTVPVMPGAGSIYKREVLLKIYDQHSGLRSGEDRESTLLGHKLGYKTLYLSNIRTLTRTPLSFRSLVRQRIRWNLGYLETALKERSFYLSQIKKFNSIGLRTMLDAIGVKLILVIPLIFLIFLGVGWKSFLIYIMCVYVGFFVWSMYVLLISPDESREFCKKRVYGLLSFPFFKVSLDSIAWIGAFLALIKKHR